MTFPPWQHPDSAPMHKRLLIYDGEFVTIARKSARGWSNAEHPRLHPDGWMECPPTPEKAPTL